MEETRIFQENHVEIDGGPRDLLILEEGPGEAGLVDQVALQQNLLLHLPTHLPKSIPHLQINL